MIVEFVEVTDTWNTTCEKCGKPAVVFTRDAIEDIPSFRDPPKHPWKTFFPGATHAWCQKHYDQVGGQ